MPSKIQQDENLYFLYICLQNSDLKIIDFAAVAAHTNLKAPAARMRYTRLKKQIEANPPFAVTGSKNEATVDTVERDNVDKLSGEGDERKRKREEDENKWEQDPVDGRERLRPSLHARSYAQPHPKKPSEELHPATFNHELHSYPQSRNTPRQISFGKTQQHYGSPHVPSRANPPHAAPSQSTNNPQVSPKEQDDDASSSEDEVPLSKQHKKRKKNGSPVSPHFPYTEILTPTYFKQQPYSYPSTQPRPLFHNPNPFASPPAPLTHFEFHRESGRAESPGRGVFTSASSRGDCVRRGPEVGDAGVGGGMGVPHLNGFGKLQPLFQGDSLGRVGSVSRSGDE